MSYERPCTCHPDDDPPAPCPRMYSLADCRRAVALRDYDALRAERDEARTEAGAWEATAQHHYKEARALEKRLAEAERDAARYRWLRDRAWPFEFNGDTPADADAAIDAAREGK